MQEDCPISGSFTWQELLDFKWDLKSGQLLFLT